MKYYYKSPAEVQEQIAAQRAKSSRPYRNRAFWIILLDIVIIVLVIGILHHQGLLVPKASTSTTTETFDGWEFSLSLPLLRKESQDVSIYLNVKNTGHVPRVFPPAEGLSQVREIKCEFYAQETFLFADALEGDRLPAGQSIAPGATSILPLGVRFPTEARAGKFSFSTRVYLVLAGRVITLPLPLVQAR